MTQDSKTEAIIQRVDDTLRSNLYWHSNISASDFFSYDRSSFDSLSEIIKRLNAKKVL